MTFFQIICNRDMILQNIVEMHSIRYQLMKWFLNNIFSMINKRLLSTESDQTYASQNV